jgi:hypothetical protein
MMVDAILSVAVATADPATRLPARVRRVVLHCLGGPSYDRPERRWVFLDPRSTQALWAGHFGAHWIVWTDGSLWPRRPAPGEPASRLPPWERGADDAWRLRLAAEARPVFAHCRGANQDSVGIEVAHTGRREDPFPDPQLRSLAWLLRSLVEMSDGRLGPDAFVGHKDLDRRPAYVSEDCESDGCRVFVDATGRPFRRRVDPPESLFAALASRGIVLARSPADDDELARAEALAEGERPQEAMR